MPNTLKVSAQTWLDTAKNALIAEGLEGVKVDRLAKTLNVTRGGFYYHFRDRADLLKRLIEHWHHTNAFIPSAIEAVTTPQEALTAFEMLSESMILEKHFSAAYDTAIREWARIDENIRAVVDEVDAERTAIIANWFEALGCDREEAAIRAQVLYLHQVGFYSLGHHLRFERSDRIRNAPIFLRILCGQRYAAAVEERANRWD